MNTLLIPNDALRLIRLIQNSGYEAYLVGGCVRDMILNKIPSDWDICTSAHPKQIKMVLDTNKISYHEVGIEFGTITAMTNSGDYEITTYRADGAYSDNRRPDTVKFKSDIKDDLKRRDFTINAMAFDPINNKLIDLFDGQSDLKNNILRTVGDPNVRFKEDSLRILRALRFAITYNLCIYENTFDSMKELVKLLDNISKERITAEFEKIFKSGASVRNWFISASFVITQLIPELSNCIEFNQNNKYHAHNVYEHMLCVVDNCKSNKFEIKLAALLHDIGKPDAYTEDELGYGHFYGHPEISYNICQNILKNRLRLTNEQYDRTINLIRYHDMTIASTRASVKRAMNKHGVDMLNDWFVLKQADMDDHIYPDIKSKYFVVIPEIKAIMADIIAEQSCFSLKNLNINGYHLMNELGLKPGKQIGIILNTLLDEVIEDKLINDNKVLLERAREIIE